MSFIKICPYCFGKGKLRSKFFPLFYQNCTDCKGTGKIQVGWDKNQVKLVNLGKYKEEK